MPWYHGPTLLEYLETVAAGGWPRTIGPMPVSGATGATAGRASFRGFAGQGGGRGTLRAGSGDGAAFARETTVRRIVTYV